MFFFLVVAKLRTEQTIECRVNKDLTVLAGTFTVIVMQACMSLELLYLLVFSESGAATDAPDSWSSVKTAVSRLLHACSDKI